MLKNSRSAMVPLTAQEIDEVAGSGPAPTVTNTTGDSTAGDRVNQAIQILSTNYNSFTSQGQQAVDQIQHIEIDAANAGRSYIDWNTHTFHLNEQEVLDASAAYVAANIMHDGDHILQHNSADGYQGVQSEQDATQLELTNADALHLSDSERQFLQNYSNDPAAIQQRIDQATNTQTSQPDLYGPYGDVSSFISPYDLGDYGGGDYGGGDYSGGNGGDYGGDDGTYGNDDYGDDSDYGYTSVGIV